MHLKSVWLFIVVAILYVQVYATKDLLVYSKQKRGYPQQQQQQQQALTADANKLVRTDLVLTVAMDGSIRGLDRRKGTVFWTLQSGSSSLVRSSTHFNVNQDYSDDNNNYNDDYQRRELRFDDVVLDSNEDEDTARVAPEEDESYYVVEPLDGGILYLYSEGKPLERLPLTMQEIVSLSPFRTETATYVGSKKTLMVAIDPRSGKIMQKYDTDAFDPTMPQLQRLPPHTLYLGRNEYKVAIFNSERQKWWNLTYAEYVPNQLDWDIPPTPSQASDVYIAADADKAITAIDVKTGDILWSRDLPFAVVNVFDVYRRPDLRIALSRQEPPLALNKGVLGDMLGMMQKTEVSTAYVGVFDGSLYCLSKEKYPLAQLSRWAPMYTGLPPGDTRPLIEAGTHKESTTENDGMPQWIPEPNPLCCPTCHQRVDCLVGRHPVVSPQRQMPQTSKYQPKQLPPNVNHSQPIETGSPQLPSPQQGIHPLWASVCLVLFSVIYMARRRLTDLSQFLFPKKDLEQAKEMATTPTQKASKLSKQERRAKPAKNVAAAADTLENNATQSQESLEEPPNVKPTGLDLHSFHQIKSSALKLSDTVLGYGSHGTVVYKGEFDGRAVAVKRLLIDFYDVAYHEVKLLQESDDHPNVVRYFYKEESDRFLYIALELCFGSLQDYMERLLPPHQMEMYDQMDPVSILRQTMNGIQHLHSLKIVHRDIKPQNILLAPSKHGTDLRVLLSDFGLCKKLDGEQTSFHYTAISPAGTVGWRAPELLKGCIAVEEFAKSQNSQSDHKSDTSVYSQQETKATRAIDIFSTGCLFYYVLTGGDHPYGDRFARESNILKGEYDLDKLTSMGEDGVDAMDLIESMLDPVPGERPTASKVLSHPFFWNPTQRLAFLQDVSDRLEVEKREPPSPLLMRLEKDADKIIGHDWYRRIDRVVAQDLRKFRKYDGKRVRDLLRALRNKKHHWQDLPDNVKECLGEPPDRYLHYFTARFPHLFLHIFHLVADDRVLRREGSLRQYF